MMIKRLQNSTLQIKTGSDFSGVGAFDQALDRLGIKQDKIFACDMDKYARQTYILNYGEPKYYPENVYDREIPTESLDIYMTSPPCQSFSLAGKRKGEDSVNGVLFYNSHEFIQKNNPKYFIFENVKGLLSDNSGKTFQTWCDMLGGKSVNGNPVIFPHEESVPYHIYHKVVNAKKCGVPQNRERVFIVGIRDDADNNFSWSKNIHLEKRLKDVLEGDVDEKYYLSENMLNHFATKEGVFSGMFNPKDEEGISSCIPAVYHKMPITNTYIKVKSATKKGYEVATEGDSINLTFPESETRRGRVGVGVGQTLDTSCNQGVLVLNHVKQINPSRESGGVQPYQHNRIYEGDIVGSLDTECGRPSYKIEHKTKKDNVLVESNDLILAGNLSGGKWDKINESCRRYYSENGIAPTIHTCQGGNTEPKVETNYKIRRLTPRECFRLMDFPDSFKWEVSDTQAYKQAGNSIVVACLVGIISKLNFFTQTNTN